MKLPPLELRVAESLDDALSLLSALGSDARILAGGQSLLPMLRFRIVRPHVLVDINRLSSLASLDETDDLRIGALVRHADVESVAEPTSTAMALLLAHAREIAFWAVRTRGTVAGSIVQADPKGDWPLALFALDADVELASSRGVRRVPVRRFIRGALETVREPDELVTGLRVARERARPQRWGRRKLMPRAGEYAMCSAVAVEYATGWECWIGAAASMPSRLSRLSLRLDDGDASPSRDELVSLAAEDLADEAPDLSEPQRHRHAGNAADAALAALQVDPSRVGVSA